MQHDLQATLTSEETKIADEFKHILQDAPETGVLFRRKPMALKAAANAYAQGIPK